MAKFAEKKDGSLNLTEFAEAVKTTTIQAEITSATKSNSDPMCFVFSDLFQHRELCYVGLHTRLNLLYLRLTGGKFEIRK